MWLPISVKWEHPADPMVHDVSTATGTNSMSATSWEYFCLFKSSAMFLFTHFVEVYFIFFILTGIHFFILLLSMLLHSFILISFDAKVWCFIMEFIKKISEIFLIIEIFLH